MANVLQRMGGTASLNLSLQLHTLQSISTHENFSEAGSNFSSCWKAHHEAVISCLAVGLLDHKLGPLLVFCSPQAQLFVLTHALTQH